MKAGYKKNINKTTKVSKVKFVNRFFSANRRFLDCMRRFFGVNYFMANHVCRMFGFSLYYKIGYVSKINLNVISDFFISYFLVERGLKKFRNNLLLLRKENGSISGYRLFKGLPSNGQRTHTNSRTVRRMFKLYNFNEI